jgi:hypothetical protein
VSRISAAVQLFFFCKGGSCPDVGAAGMDVGDTGIEKPMQLLVKYVNNESSAMAMGVKRTHDKSSR